MQSSLSSFLRYLKKKLVGLCIIKKKCCGEEKRTLGRVFIKKKSQNHQKPVALGGPFRDFYPRNNESETQELNANLFSKLLYAVRVVFFYGIKAKLFWSLALGLVVLFSSLFFVASDAVNNRLSFIVSQKIMPNVERGSLVLEKSDLISSIFIAYGDNSVVVVGKDIPPEVMALIHEMASVNKKVARWINKYRVYGPFLNKNSSQPISKIFVITDSIDFLKMLIDEIFLNLGFYLSFMVSFIFIYCYIVSRWVTKPLVYVSNFLDSVLENQQNKLVEPKVFLIKDEFSQFYRIVDAMVFKLRCVEKEKHEVLRNISHELRSPLTRMRLSLSLARNKATGLAVNEHDRIEKDLLKLNSYIARIIEWSQVVASIAYKKRQPINLWEILSEVVADANFEGNADKKIIRLAREGECYVAGLRDWLLSAFENIIRNAIRFTPRNSFVDVNLTQGKHNAVVTVRDYGVGVATDKLNHLFEPFFRVDNGQDGDVIGSGLGMAIAYSAVNWHDGNIKAENASPGLLVSITLPLTNQSTSNDSAKDKLKNKKIINASLDKRKIF